jgi:hypothetical protein
MNAEDTLKEILKEAEAKSKNKPNDFRISLSWLMDMCKKGLGDDGLR